MGIGHLDKMGRRFCQLVVVLFAVWQSVPAGVVIVPVVVVVGDFVVDDWSKVVG